MNKKYISVSAGMVMIASSVLSLQAQEIAETAAVTVTATPPTSVSVQASVRAVGAAEMPMEDMRRVPLTGNAEIDTKVKALLEEEKAKIKAIREEYSVKIKAAIGERAAVRASSTKATSTRVGVPKMIERMMERKATTTGMVRGTSSEMMVDGSVEGQGNGVGLRLRAFFRGFFGGADAQ